MNELTAVKAPESEHLAKGMNSEEAAYMRGGKQAAAGSVPMSTSKYLNSPLFVHAFSTMALRRFGNDVPPTYDIPNMSRALADVADYAAGARLIAEEKSRNPEFAAWLDARRTYNFDRSNIENFGPGTLGEAVFNFVVESGMQINFVHNFEAKSDVEYAMKQQGHSHDLLHIVTGFGANHAGEHALALMNITAAHRFFPPELAHFFNSAMYFVTSALYTRVAFNYPGAMPIVLEATAKGIEAGNAVTAPLFTVFWEDYYSWQLNDIASHFGFVRGPGAAWDFSEDLCTG